MNRMLKGLFFISLLSSAAIQADKAIGKTFFAARSQAANLAREFIGWEGSIHKPCMEEFYGCFKITPEYTRSFDRKSLGEYLFFNGDNKMVFGMPPAGTAANTAKVQGVDVNAWNFGLGGSTQDGEATVPQGFRSEVTALPRVENFLVDLGLFLGLDEWVEGLYFQLNVPLTWTRWKVNLEENISSQPQNWLANYMDVNVATNTNRPGVIEAWKGQFKFGDMQTEWKYGKIDDTKDNSKFRVADIEAILGYNFINKEKGFLGLNLRFAGPTGNKPTAEYLFEPLAGHNHWELGLGLRGKAVLWDKDCDDQELSFFLDAYVTHLFKKSQKRSFDFDVEKYGHGSRYLLLKKFNNNVYTEEMVNAINVTTLDSDVKIDCQGELLAFFYYKNGGFSMDLGYNLWGRTREKIELKEDIPANTYGFFGSNPKANPSATAGTNTGTVGNGIMPDIKIDGSWSTVPTTANNNNLISTDLIDIPSAESPSALSHKVFVNFQYNWWDNDYCPFLGIAGECEWCGNHNKALDQWGVLLTGGFSY